MSKKKLWIIIGAVLAVLAVVAVIVFCVMGNNDGKSSSDQSVQDDSGTDQNGQDDSNDQNDQIDQGGQEDPDDDDDLLVDDVITKGGTILLAVGQSAQPIDSSVGALPQSMDEKVAKVDAGGVVAAIGVGQTQIIYQIGKTQVVYNVFVSTNASAEVFTAPDTDQVALACGENSVTVGEYVAVPIHLLNSKEVAAFSVSVSYDSEKLVLKAVDSDEKSIDSIQFTDDGNGNVRVVGISYSNGKLSGDKGLFCLYFQAKSDATAGQSNIELSMNEGDMLVDGSEREIETKLYNGIVQITK